MDRFAVIVPNQQLACYGKNKRVGGVVWETEQLDYSVLVYQQREDFDFCESEHKCATYKDALKHAKKLGVPVK